MHLSWHVPVSRAKTTSRAGDEEMPKEMWDILSTLLLGQDFVSLFPLQLWTSELFYRGNDSQAKAGDCEWKASRLRKASEAQKIESRT